SLIILTCCESASSANSRFDSHCIAALCREFFAQVGLTPRKELVLTLPFPLRTDNVPTGERRAATLADRAVYPGGDRDCRTGRRPAVWRRLGSCKHGSAGWRCC